jgi:uncharacterized membrane protein YeaQ/YmgE (transglycosylase-associated protein family)
VPVFLLLNTATVAGVFAAYFLALPLLHAVSYGVVAGFIAELFPAEVRYTGSSMAYQLGGLVTSAPVPIIASMLLTSTGSSTSIALYVITACVVGAVVVAFAPRPSGTLVGTTAEDGAPVKEGAQT